MDIENEDNEMSYIKGVTKKELRIFKEVCKKNGIPLLDTPRTKEESAELEMRYSSKRNSIRYCNKNTKLRNDERVVGKEDLFCILLSDSATTKNDLELK